MKNFQKMSDTEKEIMDMIWQEAKPVTCKDLLTYFNDSRGKQWKTQTMSTFLSRLVDKEVLGYKTEKNTKGYYPLLSEKQYQQREAKQILDNMYNGSLKNFVATLFGGNDVSNEDLEDLKSWFSERQG